MANSYWRDRELKHIQKSIKNDQMVIAQINEKYQDAIDLIEEQIEAFYSRYSGKEGISMEEARKRVSELDIKRYERKAKRYVRERNFTSRANEEMRIYNLTMQINRLELLKQNIRLELIALSSDEQRIFYENLTRIAREEYQRQSGILGKTLSSPAENVEAIVNTSFHNATWSDRIWSNQDVLRSELDKLLSRGIIQGLNPRQLARELRKVVGSSIYESERLLITESARVQADVFKDSMEQADFHAYEYIAEPTACPICSALDGEIFKLSEMEIGKNMYPMHPRCRCATAGAFDRDAFEKDLESRGL
ncbi:minor capsid protein [Ornithinibacillus sp. JPR2-1]|uniref:minor capsid protein n=1 Tax=Ornithinibacillus sp. JPR2-1 TaxID=2094019 RepID=UPI0031CDFA33